MGIVGIRLYATDMEIGNDEHLASRLFHRFPPPQRIEGMPPVVERSEPVYGVPGTSIPAGSVQVLETILATIARRAFL